VPKRSNEFQDLVTLIEGISASPTTRVTSSKELSEYPDSSLREIDILIEDEINGHPVKLAVECRDYAKPQDKTWIDELIGKYRDLKVDKVVAVSSSGFTKGALRKAEEVGIRALSVRQALQADWDAVFMKPRVRFSGFDSTLTGVKLVFAPGEPDIAAGVDFTEWEIEALDDGFNETVKEAALRLHNTDAKRGINEFVVKEGLVTLEDPAEREYSINIPYTAKNRVLVAPDGTRRVIQDFVLNAKLRSRYVDADHKDVVYERKVATIATHKSQFFGSHTVAFVQLIGDAQRTVRVAYRTEGVLEPDQQVRSATEKKGRQGKAVAKRKPKGAKR
jgi:hypothetical protein